MISLALWHTIKSDLLRVGLIMTLAVVLLVTAEPAAHLFGQPAFAVWGMFAALSLFGVALAHLLRRLSFSYIDMRFHANNAKRSAEGSGLIFLGVCLVIASFISLLGNVVHAAALPANAHKYLPLLKEEQSTHWPNAPLPSAMAAQIEQETCISLTSKRCWSPRAELKTKREQGVGFGQITRTSRFDAMAELKVSYLKQLKNWSWEDNLYDPRYQLRAVVLKNLQNWQLIVDAASTLDHLAMMFVAYNGGHGGLLSDRQLCRGTANCNPDVWFGNVERTSLKAKHTSAGYGKSFFEINREYPKNILFVRRVRYAAYFGDAE